MKTSRSASSRQLHEVLFPFKGTWHLPWILERYFRATLPAFTPRKVANALLAVTEMRLGVINTHSYPVVLRIEPCNLCNHCCPV
jgi:hypothetical protein